MSQSEKYDQLAGAQAKNYNSTTMKNIFQIDEGHNSKKTAAKYRTNFRLFLDYIKIYDLDVLLDLGKEAIQELVIKYAKSMRDNSEKKYSRGTIDNRVSAILYFLDNNDIELNRRKIRRYYPPDESLRDDRPYTVEEIQKILSVCDLRTRTMVLLMVSSGVRIGSLHTMQVGDLIPVTYQGQDLYKIRVYARTHDEYYSFVTPECRVTAIDPYLESRKRHKEQITDKSPLFRKRFNELDHFRMNVPRFLNSEGSVMKAVDDCLKKSGVKTSEARRSYAWRKGFKSIAEQSGMKSINVELLMGHNIGVSRHYYRPVESDILEDYMTHAVDALTIDRTQRLQQENQDLKTMQGQAIERLKDELKARDEELKTFWKEQREQNERLKAIEDMVDRKEWNRLGLFYTEECGDS